MFSSFLLLAGLFAVTGFLSKMLHSQQASLARHWSAQGEALLRSGDAAGAIEDYRSALVYQPDDRQNEFRLAQALAAAGRTEEAQAYLARLLEVSPGNGEINRELGRLAIRAGLESEAIDYYHGAINGAWPDHPRQQRIASREELSSFLLDAGDTTRAEDELLALAATVPDDDTTDVLQTAGLFLRAGKVAGALREYQIALKNDARNWWRSPAPGPPPIKWGTTVPRKTISPGRNGKAATTPRWRTCSKRYGRPSRLPKRGAKKWK